MSSPKRNRARVLTASGLKKLREQIRLHEVEENAGFKYTLERLGELTGLDPETVKNVLDCKGSDKRTIARCFDSFGLMLEDSDHISAVQVSAAPSDPNFVGRDEAIADLNALVSRNAKVIVIQARGGVGKTTLARKYLQQEFDSFLEFPIAKETKDIASIEGLIEEKLRQLGEEPGREFLVSLDRLKRKLQAERIGILIDNLEPALDAVGKFIEPHRRYVELLRVLSDSTVKSITLITSRERLREVDVTVQYYGLRSLDVKAWEQFFQSRSINTETPALAALHNAYDGNAKAMDILSGAVLEDFAGDVEGYWQANQDDLFIERDLEDLVTKQFNRLQQLDPDAYNLLCRMGCYRYQDVPTVPIEGLFCLLWDVPEDRHRRVTKSLQDRSLIDYRDKRFWLHPVVRAEALLRLQNSQDWEKANQKAAESWTINVKTVETIEEALKAFEAYYHYLAIKDFEQAGVVIATKRENKLEGEGNAPHLGSSFYRLGLSQQMIGAINQIINWLKPSPILSRLYNLLGDQFWALGRISESIEYHKKSRDVASDYSQKLPQSEKLATKDIKHLETLANFNIGLCKLEEWDLNEALKIFDEFASKEAYGNYNLGVAHACLLFLKSCFQDVEEIDKSIDQIKIYLLSKAGSRGWAAIFELIFIGKACGNTGEIEKSFSYLEKALILASKNNFRIAESKILSCIAVLNRINADYTTAIENHNKAIQISEQISAKCVLAEGYYQLALTFQEMKHNEKAQETFQKAIRIFKEIEAPKQVKRVMQSMQSSK